jgi:hypothetical protein
MRKWIFLAAAMFCINAHTQVVKCKDTTGKVIYADRACPANFTGSSVNLSGGNITEDQVRTAQERTANAGNGGRENCGMLKNLAQQTFDSFIYNPNANRWNTSFQSLQNLANLCASPDVCGIIKARIDHAQQRFNEDNKAVRGAHLNSVSALYANTCNSNGTAKQGNARAANPGAQVPVADNNPGGNFYTKDEFGNLVRSDKCFRTPDAFGVLRRSPGCSK